MNTTPLQISYTLSNIENAAHQLWQFAHQYPVWVFNGEMGAGKTTLIHAICKNLEVSDTVSSPTFALINEYHFTENGQDRTILHMDWYRLRNTQEAIDAGMEDAINTRNAYSFIEWAEKAPDLIPSPHIRISIHTTGEQQRHLTCEQHI